MSKRSLGSVASRKKGQEIHRAERERHKQKMAHKYQLYCDSVAADYPDGTILPASYDVWQRFNKAMDQSESKEINVIPPS